MAATKLDFSRVQCPSCFHSVSLVKTILVCRNCTHEYKIVDDVAELLLRPDSDSSLDVAEYEADHPADLDARAHLFQTYSRVVQEYGADGDACLEIGSGTGNLTAGLVASDHYSEVNCSDVSLRFIRRLRELVKANEKLRCWVFDASRIPFKNGSMSAVFGHSVLHHLLDYETTVEDVFRVLRPGGLAMFGEPIMDNHSITSFCAGVILQMESRYPTNTFNDSDLSALDLLRNWSGMTGFKMRFDRKGLANLEDKHIFVVKEFIDLAKGIGFRSANYRNAFTAQQIGDDHFHQLSFMFDRLGGSSSKLLPYGFIFQELTNTYGMAMGVAAPVNFGYFILQK